jgi:hypothetical protein
MASPFKEGEAAIVVAGEEVKDPFKVMVVLI